MCDYFPLELIVEIVQRLPSKSVVRWMCVCKEWKSIITNNNFIISQHHHHQHLQTNSSLFFHLRTLDDDLYSLYSDDATNSLSVFEFPPICPFYWKNVVGTCNGLVCFADNYVQAVIWNPSILKYLILPKPTLKSHRLSYYGFGFDSQNHDFKVVRIVSLDSPYTSSLVEIYSLAAHSWRTITIEPLPFRIIDIDSKFVNGVLHWLACEINGMNQDFFLTFDIVEEKFGELMLPHSLEKAKWVFCEGSNLLALKHYVFSVSPSQCSIWVMKGYGVVEPWTFHLESTRYMHDVLALRDNEEVVLKSSDEEITFLDHVKGLERKIRHIESYISFVGDHVESLFLINENNAKTYLPLQLF